LRAIRSYTRREGRITGAQRRALQVHGARYLLGANKNPIDLDTVFGRRAPRALEIGSGAGEVVRALAHARPEWDFIAVEVYRPGIGRLLNQLAASGSDNVRVVATDAAELIETAFTAASFEAIFVFFPDPWPKSRHHKRRLLRESVLRRLRELLMPHGRLYVATDWPDYAESILHDALAAGFGNLAGAAGYAPRPQWRPRTRFEAKALRAGRPIHEFVFCRSPRV
jgi:tRNA (guanine-N7-)-methyltransferase